MPARSHILLVGFTMIIIMIIVIITRLLEPRQRKGQKYSMNLFFFQECSLFFRDSYVRYLFLWIFFPFFLTIFLCVFCSGIAISEFVRGYPYLRLNVNVTHPRSNLVSAHVRVSFKKAFRNDYYYRCYYILASTVLGHVRTERANGNANLHCQKEFLSASVSSRINVLLRFSFFFLFRLAMIFLSFKFYSLVLYMLSYYIDYTLPKRRRFQTRKRK